MEIFAFNDWKMKNPLAKNKRLLGTFYERKP